MLKMCVLKMRGVDELVEAETEMFTVQLATGGCGGLKQVEASCFFSAPICNGLWEWCIPIT